MKKLWSIILILALVVAPCVIAHEPGAGSAANAAVLSGVSFADTHTDGTATSAGAPHTHSAENIRSKAHNSRSSHNTNSSQTPAPNQTALAGLVHNHSNTSPSNDDNHDCEQNCNGWMSAGSANALARSTQHFAGADPIILPPVYAAVLVLRLGRPGERVAMQAYFWPARQRTIEQLSVLERTGRLRI